MEEQRNKIIEQLGLLNTKMEKQSSVKYILMSGIIHGIGFFLGSAVIATIALGIFGPIFGKFEWVRTSYEEGASILKGNIEQQ